MCGDLWQAKKRVWKLDGEVEKVLWNHLKSEQLLVSYMYIAVGAEISSVCVGVCVRTCMRVLCCVVCVCMRMLCCVVCVCLCVRVCHCVNL